MKETTTTHNRNPKANRAFSRILTNRKGVAEIVGGVLLFLILVFFFTNVYLWNDRATSEMNVLNSQKMNSPINVSATNEGFGTDEGFGPVDLSVSNLGTVDVCLSRLWIYETINYTINEIQEHFYAELQNTTGDPDGIWIAPGNPVNIYLNFNPDAQGPFSSPIPVSWNGNQATIQCPPPAYGTTVTFKILTTLGNGASCAYYVPFPYRYDDDGD